MPLPKLLYAALDPDENGQTLFTPQKCLTVEPRKLRLDA